MYTHTNNLHCILISFIMVLLPFFYFFMIFLYFFIGFPWYFLIWNVFSMVFLGVFLLFALIYIRFLALHWLPSGVIGMSCRCICMTCTNACAVYMYVLHAYRWSGCTYIQQYPPTPRHYIHTTHIVDPALIYDVSGRHLHI